MPEAAGRRPGFRQWLGLRQQRLSDKVHAAGDAYACVQGWEIRASTGRFGFGAREYRDARFATRAAATARDLPGSSKIRPLAELG